MKTEAIQAALTAYDIEAECIREMKEYFNEEVFAKAVELLAKAPRIGTTGCGHSGIICQHMSHLMCCIERPARFISPSEAVHGGLGFLKPGDVMLLASRGGKTDELLPIAGICRQRGVTVIGVTENISSPLAEKSDYVIAMAVTRECDKYNCQGTTSFAVTAAIFDALQTAVLEYCDFRNEEFAAIHPGGAVGKRLNAKES